MDKVNVSVLGTIAAEKVRIGGPSNRRILAMLVLADGDTVSIDQMADALWSEDMDPERAEKNLHSYVSRLRSALDADGREVIRTHPRGYALATTAVTIDLHRFEALAAEAHRDKETGRFDQAIANFDDALRLWSDPPFGEFASEPWARTAVERVRELHRRVIEERADSLLRLARPADAANAVGTLIETDPFREEPQRIRMLGLHRAGRTVEALRSYQNFRNRLAEEIGAEPSTGLQRLDRRIATGEEPSTSDGADISVRGYDIHERIGSGAFADVFRGIQPGLGRPVAVKAIRKEFANLPAFIRAFEAEANTIARLEHPHIVPLYDFWREPDRAYLVMRWLHGGTLEQSLQREQWGAAQTATLVKQVGAGLATAHRANIVHRDVKPANILLDDMNNAFLSDFGIAVEATQRVDPRLGLSLGSPAYSSPEQIRRQPVTPLADQFSLAITAFETLTGTLPFAHPERDDALPHEIIPSVTEFVPGLPRAIDEVLRQATAKNPLERFADIEHFVAAFVEATTSAPTRSGAASDRGRLTTLLGIENPYVGLRAFDETEAVVFHGRERLTQSVLDRLSDGDRLVALIGASGSGKSSVVRAGLLPELRQGAISNSDSWYITAMTPGVRPFESLEAALLRIAVNPPAGLLEVLSSGPRGIARAARRAVPTDDATVLLVIDQFEELFTLCEDETERRLFLDGLHTAIAHDSTHLRIVLTLRADFYDHPLRYPGFAEHIRDHGMTVTPLAAEELEQAVVAPAAQVGIAFEPGLVAEIVAAFSTQPGALPLLQYLLAELFDHRVDNTMMVEAYQTLGGVNGALAHRAEELFNDATAATQSAIASMFTRLVSLGEGSEDTRRRVRRSELRSSDAMDAAIDRYVAARLVTVDRDRTTREPTLEVAHEALIREWPRLRSWLDDDRADLRAHHHLHGAALTWDNRGQPSEDLYRGGRLELVESWLDEDRELNEVEERFIVSSIQERSRLAALEQQHLAETERQNTRLQRLLVAVGIIAAIALAAGGLAFTQRGNAIAARDDADAARIEAETERINAEESRDEAISAHQVADQTARAAETSRLVSTSASLAGTNPRVAALLARAAYNRERTPETLGALQAALSQSGPLLGWLGSGTEFTDVEWTDTGVVAAASDAVILYDPDTGEELDRVDANVGRGLVPGATETDRLHANATLAIFVDDDMTAQVYSTLDRRFTHVASLESSLPIVSVAVRPDGQRFVTADIESNVAGWGMDGVADFSVDVDDFPSVYDQFLSRFDESVLFGEDLFRQLPVLTGVYAYEDHILVSAVTRVGRMGWNGEWVAEPVYSSVVDAGPLSGFPAAPRLAWSDGDSYVLGSTASLSIGQLADRPDEYEYRVLGSTGPGSGEIVESIGEADGVPNILLSDGRVIRPDLETFESTTLVDLGLSGASGGAAHPRQAGLGAIATPSGVALVSTLGGGAIAAALPRPASSDNTGVSHDGRFVLAGGAGVSAPTRLWALTDHGYEAIAPPESREVSSYAAIPVDEGDVLLIGAPPQPQSAYALEHEQPQLIGTGASPAATTGDGHVGLDLAVYGLDDIRVYDRTTFEFLLALPAPPSDAVRPLLSGLRFDPSGERLLASLPDGTSQIWDPATWTVIEDEAIKSADIAIGYWNGDGTRMATASSTGTISIRDGATYEVIQEMIGAVNTSNSWNDGGLLFSADGTTLLTNFDGTGRLWDIESGEQIGVAISGFPGTTSGMNTGEILQLTTGGEHAVLVWNLDMNQWPEIACRVAGTNLSDAEWRQWGPRDEPLYPICEDH